MLLWMWMGLAVTPHDLLSPLLHQCSLCGHHRSCRKRLDLQTGTGAYVQPSIGGQPNLESGSYAQFYAYGFNNAQMRQFGLAIFRTSTGMRAVPAAQFMSRTVTVSNPDGTPRTTQTARPARTHCA